MLLLTIVFTFLPIIFSYSIILYLLSSEYDIVRLMISKFEEKLANIDSKSLRVLIKFSILIFEINYKILTFLSFALPLEQRGHRIEATKTPAVAKEAGALQEANDNLQKEVEELAWRLQVEKLIRTDLEQETLKLRNSLQAALAKVNETNALLIKERESVQKAIEEASAIVKETVPVHVEMKDSKDVQGPSMQTKDVHVEERPRKSLNDNPMEYHDFLIRCIAQPLGFSKGRPVAACIIYKCLRQWESFEVEETNVFDRVLQTIDQAIESQDNNEVLAYWLSNTSTLLFLLMKSDDETTDEFDTLQQLEAKYHALHFKQQLTTYVEKIYRMIRGNLNKELSPVLGMCIQEPRISKEKFLNGSSVELASSASHDSSTAHWQGIVDNINVFLKLLISNNVPPFLVSKIFTRVFSFIDIQLFNSLLLRRECCTMSNGEYLKEGLSELEQWCYKATEMYAGSAWDELKHIWQATGFLVIHQKQNKTLDEICHDLCPDLNILQIYRLSTTYWDDKYGSLSLTPDVICNMRELMTEDSNNAVSCSVLLDDDSSKPFCVDDLLKSMDGINIADIEPPPLFRDNPGFSFLLQHAES